MPTGMHTYVCIQALINLLFFSVCLATSKDSCVSIQVAGCARQRCCVASDPPTSSHSGVQAASRPYVNPGCVSHCHERKEVLC